MTDSSNDPVIDPGDFRQTLGHFATGVTVVTAGGSNGPVGVAIGSFASISLDPPLVGFFLGTESGSWPQMEEVGHFCVNILRSDQQELCGLMASKSADKFAGVESTPAPGTGAPILPGVLGVIDCRIDRVVETGDHNLIIGRVLHLGVIKDGDVGPMVFFKGQYGSFAP
ncbi:MAG: flavin reductase family protein [Actinomycetia bacterium]|nr:flavin reductase family protein [Actinomycetes bacterium]